MVHDDVVNDDVVNDDVVNDDVVNDTILLSLLVDMSTLQDAVCRELPGEADTTVRQLYSLHAQALHCYVGRFCPDRASAG